MGLVFDNSLVPADTERLDAVIGVASDYLAEEDIANS